MQCDGLMLLVGLSFLTLSLCLRTDWRRFTIVPRLGGTGAVAGGDGNYGFIEHFQDMAGRHFIVRRLERAGALLELARSDLKRRHKPSESPVHDAGRAIGAPARPLCRDLDARRRG